MGNRTSLTHSNFQSFYWILRVNIFKMIVLTDKHNWSWYTLFSFNFHSKWSLQILRRNSWEFIMTRFKLQYIRALFPTSLKKSKFNLEMIITFFCLLMKSFNNISFESNTYRRFHGNKAYFQLMISSFRSYNPIIFYKSLPCLWLLLTLTFLIDIKPTTNLSLINYIIRNLNFIKFSLSI